MSLGRRFLAALVRSPRRTRRCAARAVHFPPTLGSPVNGRHARFEALLPPGVRSATTSLPGQAEDARRCSPGVLALQSSLHHGPGFGHSQRHTRGAEAPCHVRPWAPSHRGCTPRPGLRRSGSRARDPSMRRVYRTPRTTVERRPSSPSASRALPCASRQPRLAPCRALKDGASCSCPLSAAPRAFLPLTALSPGRGEGRWTSKTLSSNRSPDTAPCEAGWRPNPSRSSVWSPVAGWTPTRLTFASRVSSCDPLLREEQVGGGPPCRQVGRLSWDFVPRRLGSEVRATSGAGLFAFRVRSFRT
jgi:hypothetical protein